MIEIEILHLASTNYSMSYKIISIIPYSIINQKGYTLIPRKSAKIRSSLGSSWPDFIFNQRSVHFIHFNFNKSISLSQYFMSK